MNQYDMLEIMSYGTYDMILMMNRIYDTQTELQKNRLLF